MQFTPLTTTTIYMHAITTHANNHNTARNHDTETLRPSLPFMQSPCVSFPETSWSATSPSWLLPTRYRIITPPTDNILVLKDRILSNEGGVIFPSGIFRWQVLPTDQALLDHFGAATHPAGVDDFSWHQLQPVRACKEISGSFSSSLSSIPCTPLSPHPSKTNS